MKYGHQRVITSLFVPICSCIPDHAPVVCIKPSYYFFSVGWTKLCLRAFLFSDVTRSLYNITVGVTADLSGEQPEHYLVRLKITVTWYVISEFGLPTFSALFPHKMPERNGSTPLWSLVSFTGLLNIEKLVGGSCVQH